MTKLRAFVALCGLGWLGVASLLLTLDTATLRSTGQVPAMSDTGLRLLLLLQPALLVALGTTAGFFAAHRVGLRSVIADRVLGRSDTRFGRAELMWGVAGGLLAGALIILGDLVLVAIADGHLERLRVGSEARLPALLMGLLYGGISEEIITRWGLMSLLAWALVRMALPHGIALASAAGLAALLFAVAHLPALALTGVTPGAVIVARTLILNTVVGAIFGALYWRRNLETAMLGHALAHIVLFIGRSLGVAL